MRYVLKGVIKSTINMLIGLARAVCRARVVSLLNTRGRFFGYKSKL